MTVRVVATAKKRPIGDMQLLPVISRTRPIAVFQIGGITAPKQPSIR